MANDLEVQDQEPYGREIDAQAWLKVRTSDPVEPLDVLLDYQKEALLLSASHQVLVVEKSRRIGLTWGFASDAVITAAAKKNAGGQSVFYIGYNLEMAREFIATCGEWAKKLGETLGEVEELIWEKGDKEGEKSILAFRVKFASGFSIIALPSKPRSLRGMQGKIIIDEAAFHEDLGELLKAALALLIWGGSLVIISTHDGEDNAFNLLVQEVRAGKKPYGLLRVDFDEALRDGFYRRVCETTKKKWSLAAEAEYRAGIVGNYGTGADEELYCIPSKGSGTFLNASLISAVTNEESQVIRYQAPKDFLTWSEKDRKAETGAWLELNIRPQLARLNPRLRSVFGHDFARVADLSVFWPKQVLANTRRHTPFILELRDVPFESQKQILFYILKRLPRLSGGAMDAGGNGAYLAEVTAAKFGLRRIHQVHFSRDWYRENTPRFKAAFEDQELDIPKDDNVLGDHRLFKQVNGVAQIPSDKRTLEIAGKGARRHGDSAIANLLAEFAAHTSPHEYGWWSIHDDEEFGDRDESEDREIGGDFGSHRRRGI